MGNRGFSASSVVSAGVLSVLTLATFAYSRDRGPESSVRRFHQAIVSRDLKELERVTVKDKSDALNYLVQSVDGMIQRSDAVVLDRVEQSGRDAYIDVKYRFPMNRGIFTLRYVVVLDGRRWKIDARQTLALREQMNAFS
ncbi:MAG: hypothetical protein KDC26_09110 [Armatimonadetes bacterium]|nr:hypothetical protein [Armatimonadota bacterium]